MRIRKRIELENIKVFRSETTTENPDGSGGNGNNTQSVPDCGIKFRLRGETLDGFGPRQPAETPMKTVKSIHLWEDGMKRK